MAAAGATPEFEFVDASALPERLPMFPPPNVVLFPNMLLPLHIFEARYKRMVGECLAGRRLLGMLLYRKGWEEAEDPAPYDVGCMGQITQAVKLPMGKYDIVLRGLGRVRVLEYVQVRPYRIARVEHLEDRTLEAEVAEVLGRELADRLKRIAAPGRRWRPGCRAWPACPARATCATSSRAITPTSACTSGRRSWRGRRSRSSSGGCCATATGTWRG